MPSPAQVAAGRVPPIVLTRDYPTDLDAGLLAQKGPPPSGDITGVTDSAALTALFAVPGVYQLQPGAIYWVNSDVIVGSGVTVFAYGVTIKLASGSTANLVNFSGTSTSLKSGFRWHGGILDGSKTTRDIPAGGYTSNAGFKLQWCADFVIADCEIRNCTSGGIIVGDSIVSEGRLSRIVAHHNNDNQIWCRPGCFDILIEQCVAWGSTYSGIQAIRCDYITIANCHAFANGPAKSTEGDGFGFEGCRYSQMIGCVAWANSSQGFKVDYTTEGGSGFSWQGTYSSATVYSQGQAVSWQNQNYYALVAPPGAGNAPYPGSPYWVPCAFGPTGNQYSAQISLRSCRALYNVAQTNRGNWVSGGTYAIQDSVVSTDTFAYVCYVAVSGSATVPQSDGAHWFQVRSLGFQTENCNGLHLDDCEANNNDLYGWNGGGVLTDVVLKNFKAYSNGSNGIREFDTASVGPFVFEDCDVSGNGSNGIDIQAKATIRGGRSVKNTGEGIQLSGDIAVVIEDIELSDNTDNGIVVGHSLTTPLLVRKCRAFNPSTNQGRFLFEGTGNGPTRIENCYIRNQSNQPFSLSNASSYTRDNDIGTSGYLDQNSGSATVAASGSSVVVTHGLWTTPTRVEITPTADSGITYRTWISAKGATQFTINTSPALTNQTTFDWRAWTWDN